MATIKTRYGKYAVIDTGKPGHDYVSAEVRTTWGGTEYDVVGTHSNILDAEFTAEALSKNTVSLYESIRPRQWQRL